MTPHPTRLVLLLGIAGATLLAGAPAAALPDPGPVAVVEGQPVRAGVVAEELRHRFPRHADGIEEARRSDTARSFIRALRDALGPAAVEEAVDDLVDRELVRQAAARADVLVSDREVDRRVERARAAIEADPAYQGASFEQVLSARHEDLRTFRADVRMRLRLEKLADPVTEADVRRRFESLRPWYAGGRVRVRMILAEPGEDGEDETREELTRLARRIEAGEVEFAAAARERSDDPATAERGGDLGWLSPDAPYPEPLLRAAFAAGEGEVVGPLETRFGLHLLLVEEVEPGTDDLSLADVRDEVRADVAGERARSLLEELRAGATILRADQG